MDGSIRMASRSCPSLFFPKKKSIYFDSGDQVRPIKIVLIVDSRPRIWTGCHGTSGGQKPARSKFKSFSGVRTRQTGEACHREESAWVSRAHSKPSQSTEDCVCGFGGSFSDGAAGFVDLLQPSSRFFTSKTFILIHSTGGMADLRWSSFRPTWIIRLKWTLNFWKKLQKKKNKKISESSIPVDASGE